MKELFEAITTKFNNIDAQNNPSSFYASISGRLYLVNAPEGATLPYAVYSLIANPVDYNFTSVFDNPVIQFSLFAEATGHSEILNMHSYLKDQFDDCQLSVTGYQYGKMERQLDLGLLKDPDHEVFHYPVQYEIWLRKNL